EAGVDAVPLRVAGGARPDGAPSRDDATRALERLEARAVHEREKKARLGLGKARLSLSPGGPRREPPGRDERPDNLEKREPVLPLVPGDDPSTSAPAKFSPRTA